jgi:hypothetical protein
VGLLSIQGSQFQIAEIPLKTVRPFIHDEVALSQCAQEPLNEIDMEDRDSITRFLRKKVSCRPLSPSMQAHAPGGRAHQGGEARLEGASQGRRGADRDDASAYPLKGWSMS